jgi:predicted transcriptional regulator
MKVLLSIKPEFANKIFNGEKKYEYRKSLFKNESIRVVVVYASSPISKVIGEFEIDDIIVDDLQGLWEKTEAYAGISRDYYYKYFGAKSKGYAIKIKNAIRYPSAENLKEKYNITPPQSFAYLSACQDEHLCFQV